MYKRILLSAAVLYTVASASGYDATLSKRAAYYSSASYCAKAGLQSWSCGAACSAVPGVTSVTVMENYIQGTYGFVGYSAAHNEIMVAFRGSHNIANWIENIDFNK
jgi:hypothetical protein